MDRVAQPDDPVLVGAADLGVLVIVVGVVGADLHGFMNRPVKLRGQRIGVLDEGLEAGARQPAEVAEALRAVEHIVGRSIGENDLPGRLEGVAELIPGPAAADAVDGGLFAHDSILSLGSAG